MDGNGRWAVSRGLERSEGHVRGYQSMLRVIRYACDAGVSELSFFALSGDNLDKRSKRESAAICDLVCEFATNECPKLLDDGIRVMFFGSFERLPERVRAAVDKVNGTAVRDPKMTVAIAVAYDGKEDVLQAAGTDDFERHLQTYPLSDVEMLVRTGGEKRLSDFMLYRLGYAELMFDEILWPDVGKTFFEKIITEYRSRDRRFGGYGEKNE